MLRFTPLEWRASPGFGPAVCPRRRLARWTRHGAWLKRSSIVPGSQGGEASQRRCGAPPCLGPV